jgi:sugar transferase (PEP-CTERM/EpsH1 system associated)
MRDLLFLAHRIPYPPSKGEKIRGWHFLRHLAGTRRVHLGCFVDDDPDWAHVPFLKELVGESCFLPLRGARALARSLPALVTGRPLTLPYYYDRRMARWIRGLRQDRPMTVFVYSSSMAQYVATDAGSPRIIDFVDVDSQKWRDYSERRRWPMSAVYRREGRTLLAAERRIAREFDASIFVSEAEAALFRQLAPESAHRVSAVSMGVDTERFSPDADCPDPYDGAGPSTLCFTGMMDYWPNVDAVTWFAHSVFPRIRRARPTARFWIVGANPSRAVQQLADEPGVVVTGRVPDTRPYLAHATAVVAPLRIARGVQNKVLEAMAMGRPVIASAQAFEGLRVEAERDLIVARSSDEFVRAVERVWDGRLVGTLGVSARHTVQTHYDWPSQLAALDAVLGPLEAAADRRGPALTMRTAAACQS